MQSQSWGGTPVCGSCPFPGTGACDFYAKGGAQKAGSCGCGGRIQQQQGGGCGCGGPLFRGGGTRKHKRGGYKATKKNLNALKKWRKGQSIGFTMTASLKAKGLIPRTSRKLKGRHVVSRKYR